MAQAQQAQAAKWARGFQQSLGNVASNRAVEDMRGKYYGAGAGTDRGTYAGLKTTVPITAEVVAVLQPQAPGGVTLPTTQDVKITIDPATRQTYYPGSRAHLAALQAGSSAGLTSIRIPRAPGVGRGKGTSSMVRIGSPKWRAHAKALKKSAPTTPDTLRWIGLSMLYGLALPLGSESKDGSAPLTVDANGFATQDWAQLYNATKQKDVKEFYDVLKNPAQKALGRYAAARFFAQNANNVRRVGQEYEGLQGAANIDAVNQFIKGQWEGAGQFGNANLKGVYAQNLTGMDRTKRAQLNSYPLRHPDGSIFEPTYQKNADGSLMVDKKGRPTMSQGPTMQDVYAGRAVCHVNASGPGVTGHSKDALGARLYPREGKGKKLYCAPSPATALTRMSRQKDANGNVIVAARKSIRGQSADALRAAFGQDQINAAAQQYQQKLAQAGVYEMLGGLQRAKGRSSDRFGRDQGVDALRAATKAANTQRFGTFLPQRNTAAALQGLQLGQ